MIAMDMQPVNSSNINSVGYDIRTKTLRIEFHGGSIYEYYNVPEHVYAALMSAPSHGSYFHQNIKNNYQSTGLQ